MENSMIKIFLGAIVLITMILVSAISFAEDGFSSINELDEWMTFYYLNPTPERVPVAIKYFSENPAYKTNVHIPTAAFFAALFRKDPLLMQKSFHDLLHEQANTRILMMEAIYMTGTGESLEALNLARQVWFSDEQRLQVDFLLADIPKDVFDVKVDDVQRGSESLDILWATFSATGAKGPILKIISVACLVKDGQGNERIVGSAANWSLGSNAKTHKRVLEICKEELKNADGTKRELLEKIVQGVR